MPRVTTIQTNFTAGEISPRLSGRVDVAKYANAAETLENFIVTPHGGASRRPGTRFVAAAKEPARKCRLVAFEFSTEQAYVLELGHRYCRFYRNGGRIAAGPTSAAVTNGDFTAGIAGWDDRSDAGASIAHDAANGRLDLVGAAGKVAWAEQDIATGAVGTPHVVRFRIVGDPRDRVELRVGSGSTGDEILADALRGAGWHTVSFTPTASPFHLQFRNNGQATTIAVDDVAILAGEPVEIATPYDEAQLFELAFTQSADILYIAHDDHPPRELSRTGHTDWSLTAFEFRDGPYRSTNTESGRTLAPGGTSGAVTITAAGFKPFAATDIGRLVRIRHGGTWGHARITGFTSAAEVTAAVVQDFNGTAASADWRLGAWSDSTGWPTAVTFFQERLWWGGTRAEPQTIWGSASGDFTSYRPTRLDDSVEDDDGLGFTIADDRVNAIRWMSAGKRLAIGTTGGEFTMAGGGGSEAITPTQVQVTRETTHGVARIPAKRIGPVVLFAQRQRRKIREFVFNFDVDSFKAPDLALLAEHITGTGIVDMDYQQEPDSVLWCVRDDGVLLGMTYERDQDVVGWHRHVLGGVSDAAGGSARCESVAVIPAAGRDETWVSVQRLVDGSVRRHIEFLERDLDPDNDGTGPEHAFHVDGGLTLDAPVALAGATQADPVVLTAPAHGLADGDSVRIAGVAGMTEVNGRDFTVGGILAAAIGGAADSGSGLVRITATAHGFATGDSVTIAGVLGTVEANGTHAVTAVDADRFDLDGSAFANAYVSGGVAVRDTVSLVGEDGTGHAAYVSGGALRRRVAAVAGLDHLEGETVAILADGAVQPDRVVAAGAVALERPAAIVHVGLPYVSRLRTLRPEGAGPAGMPTAQGQRKRVVEAVIRFWNSIGGRFGGDEGALEVIPSRAAADPMGIGPPLFTGDRTVQFPGNWETAGQVTILQDQPLPMTVLAVVKRLVVNEA